MRIKWNKVTWYSKLAAVVVFVGTFILAFYFGHQAGELNAFQGSRIVMSPRSGHYRHEPMENNDIQNQPVILKQNPLTNVAIFSCPKSKTIAAAFYLKSVDIKLSDSRTYTLPQTISADGARYANADETFVFWNKGNSAFIEEGATTTYQNCVTK